MSVRGQNPIRVDQTWLNRNADSFRVDAFDGETVTLTPWDERLDGLTVTADELRSEYELVADESPEGLAK